jgi:hypothetical protein
MREATISLPRLGAIAVTRGLLGIGIGLLLSERLSSQARRYAGIALAAVGVLSTIPLAAGVVRRVRHKNGDNRRVASPEGLAAD